MQRPSRKSSHSAPRRTRSPRGVHHMATVRLMRGCCDNYDTRCTLPVVGSRAVIKSRVCLIHRCSPALCVSPEVEADKGRCLSLTRTGQGEYSSVISHGACLLVATLFVRFPAT